jgi:hypothetical protein
MKNINTIAVGMRAAGAGRALGSVFAAWPAHAATAAHATATAPAAQRKHRTADATATFVDRGPI